jgi:hypothetical protein
MIATDKTPARLATHRTTDQIDRARVGGGYRPTTLMARLRAPRLNALQRLCAGAERKPAWLYDAQRAEPRSALPDERLDAAIVQGIRDGYITPEKLADYYGELFASYRAMMPGGVESTFIDTTRESAEALEAIAIARVVPSAENNAHAARELLESAIVSTAHARRLQCGDAA